jgi:hypothetical protein
MVLPKRCAAILHTYIRNAADSISTKGRENKKNERNLNATGKKNCGEFGGIGKKQGILDI